ncbi:nucleotide exchange factor GrpE [Candidatus Bathyarchaeota archaeon]|nr:MAG: nucleotide exchange factor GrpE [Candidatus Bathyarchaeota archaeon]
MKVWDKPMISPKSGEEKEKKEKESENGKGKSLEEELENLRKALEEERKKSEEYLVRLKYLQADFENYQKRVKKEIDEAVRVEVEKLILKFLNVLDNLELALKVGKESSDKDALIKGVEITLKGLEEVLKEEGLTRIEAEGKPFNPAFHEAVENIQTDNLPENFVVEELRKGYILRGKVIRPSMVKVSKPIQQK